MGQRLVVDVNDGDRTLCKIHYHWSAYTVSAFEELATLADILAPLRDTYQSLTPDERRREVVATLARGLVARGGGINGTDADRAAFERLCPDVDLGSCAPSRNYGLVALDPASMQEYDQWAEGTAMVDLGSWSCCNGCLYAYETVDEANEELGDDYREDDLPVMPSNTSPFDARAIEHVAAAYDGVGGLIKIAGEPGVYEMVN